MHQLYSILLTGSLALLTLNSCSSQIEASAPPVPTPPPQSSKLDVPQQALTKAETPSKSANIAEKKEHPALTTSSQPTQTRDEAIDWLTDLLLNKVNPELNGRKLQSGEARYISEWKAIRQVIAEEMNPAATNCVGDLYWELPSYDANYGSTDPNRIPHISGTFDRIADAIFYSRHPELVGTRLSAANSEQTREWDSIRQAIIVEQPCS